MMDRTRFQPEPFREVQPPEPDYPTAPTSKRTLLQRLIPALERRREAAHQAACASHEAELSRLRGEWESAQQAWEKRRAEHARTQQEAKVQFEGAQQEKNDTIRSFRDRFEAGDADAIDEYARMVFERSVYPQSFSVSHECHFDPPSKTLLIDVSLPAPTDVPTTVGFKTADRNTRVVPIDMKAKEHDELYDGGVKQVVLRSMHEVFESIYTSYVEAVVVNGWTTITNRSTGHDETSCIVSVGTDRKTFEAINLARIDPTECIKNLKGLIAGPLAQVAPVKPLMTFDRDDPRFVESKDVMAEFNARTNLAEIPWEDFEHLVRELFSRLFASHGAEVRVTQASRDAGVDAVAFDPDPIRGGKFVIQAKRYNNVVPVSAVRDLYGTMINEGAAKGILVTTAYYGRDSREFAKDKPITLIDGSNLVHLLEEQGHKVRIDIRRKRLKLTPV
jgi:restriction system protein